MLTKPLTNDISRPVVAAATWSWVALALTLIATLLVAGIGSGVALVRSWIQGVPWSSPRAAVQVTLWLGVPTVLIASCWAAAYASTQRQVWRFLPAAFVGGLFGYLTVAHTWHPWYALEVAGIVVALGLGWSLAIPFSRSSRLAARVIAVGALGLVVAFAYNPPEVWILALEGLMAPIPVALVVWIGDAAWKAAVRPR